MGCAIEISRDVYIYTIVNMIKSSLELAGREKEHLVTHVNIPQRLCQDSGKKMEEDMRWGRLPSIWGIRAYGKKKKAVKGILSGGDVFVTGSKSSRKG